MTNCGFGVGWVTKGDELTINQQIIALGNGVLPAQAASALQLLTVEEKSRRSIRPRTHPDTRQTPFVQQHNSDHRPVSAR